MGPTFKDLTDRMVAVHEKKKHDYSNASNMFSNFEFSAELAAHFSDSTDKVFVTLIGVKLARLAELLNSDREPLNESVDDSFLDLTNYCALWWLNRASRAAHGGANQPMVVDSGIAKQTVYEYIQEIG